MHDVRRLAVERRQREAAQRVAYERSETRRPLSVSSGEVLPPLRDMEQPSIGGEDFAALPVERRRTEAEVRTERAMPLFDQYGGCSPVCMMLLIRLMGSSHLHAAACTQYDALVGCTSAQAAEAAATPQEKAEGEAVEECRPLDEIFELLRAKIDQGYHSYRHVFRELGKHDEEKCAPIHVCNATQDIGTVGLVIAAAMVVSMWEFERHNQLDMGDSYMAAGSRRHCV
eukprot:SAG11_NODE_567_length_8488_cov_4.292764_5_plen_228_part_00